MPHGLSGLRVVSFESRRSAEVAELIRNYGGEPIQAPSMREIPLADQHEALAFGEALLAGDQDVLILLTGVGTRLLIATLTARWPREEVVVALGRLTLVCRGPKPIAALKEVGLVPTLAVPEPNTWRDVLSELDHKLSIGGKRVAVQEYGVRNEELLAGLRQRGAHVTTWRSTRGRCRRTSRRCGRRSSKSRQGRWRWRSSAVRRRLTTCFAWQLK